MKRFDALITTQRTSALYEVSFLENQEKPPEKGIFEKKVIIFGFYFFLSSEMGLCRELRFFALQPVHQNATTKLSNKPLG